jgi:hypothetical protein
MAGGRRFHDSPPNPARGQWPALAVVLEGTFWSGALAPLSIVNVAGQPYSAQNDGMAQPARRLAASLALASFAVSGQAPISAANQSAVPVALALHDATPIRLRLTRDLTFTNAKPGDKVEFEIVDDLRIDGLLVIARGVRATAISTQAEPKTRMGRGGKLGVSLNCLPLLDGGKVAIRAAKEGRAAGHADTPAVAEVAAAAMAKPEAPPLLFAFGKDEAFPEGTGVAAYIDGEVKLDPARFLADIAFTSNPPGALVSMYGAPIGRTPFTTRLAPGAYKAVFSADGYYNLTQRIVVGPGYSNTVHAAFELK